MTIGKKIEMTPRNQINLIVDEMNKLLRQVENLADNHGISFDFLDRTYTPKIKPYNKSELLKMIKDGTFVDLSHETKEAAIRVLSGEEDSTDWNSSNYDESGWNSSNC